MENIADRPTSELDHIPTAWLLTGLVVFPFVIYQLLGFLSPLIHNLTAMRISEIYVYPIKSLRAVPLNEAVATQYGFEHDRTFMLVKKKDDGTWTNMNIGRFPEMSQFLQEFENYGTNDATIRVTFRAYGDADKARTIRIPLVPDTEKLEHFGVDLLSSATDAFNMGEKYSRWFSECLGYEAVFLYVGDNKRAVIFQDMQPLTPDPLTAFFKKNIPFLGRYVEQLMGIRQTEPWRIKFHDCAPFLITSKTSLDDVSARLEGEKMDMTKFRPNIVIEGANEPWQEDYWGKIKINQKTEMIMAHNCIRCQSVNVDYNTGKPGLGPSGQVLKRLAKDRRIDQGAKWSSVFGRYTFWAPNAPKSQTIKVGDKVHVTKVNEGTTIWSWPGLGSIPKPS
ncbi:uncharacterized protein EKO05_0000180 [Ascochyta rabiei]|uniref:Catalytic n=1 Tax=Didymella rabiei TaxID=5454 RepID=A0A163C9P8_DIDRA|nr:uncharacterized protein EKO05_0000180 [Ascochyta rabiei]KZM22306.1 catalytic [Ascochyta rabiei]UPX09491.1 hypothetical protein EKO05_0000180 [Ascochyta rabiei]